MGSENSSARGKANHFYKHGKAKEPLYQKWTGQPIHLAGSKNPLPLGMGSVKHEFYLKTIEAISLIKSEMK